MTCSASFDHLVGAGEHAGWHGEAGRARGLEVDHYLVPSWRLHRQVGGLLAAENAIDVPWRLPILVDRVRPGGDQGARSDEVAHRVDGGQTVLSRACADQAAMPDC